MVCPYCSNKTSVKNSRPQARTASVWRRRSCKDCGALFTTEEYVKTSSVCTISYPDGSLEPLNRLRLACSIKDALASGKDLYEDAQHIADSIIATLLTSGPGPSIDVQKLTERTLGKLQVFSVEAGLRYAVSHKLYKDNPKTRRIMKSMNLGY